MNNHSTHFSMIYIEFGMHEIIQIPGTSCKCMPQHMLVKSSLLLIQSWTADFLILGSTNTKNLKDHNKSCGPHLDPGRSD